VYFYDFLRRTRHRVNRGLDVVSGKNVNAILALFDRENARSEQQDEHQFGDQVHTTNLGGTQFGASLRKKSCKAPCVRVSVG
jgi:hypothetical protein